jgi:hypothetical protein
MTFTSWPALVHVSYEECLNSIEPLKSERLLRIEEKLSGICLNYPHFGMARKFAQLVCQVDFWMCTECESPPLSGYVGAPVQCVIKIYQRCIKIQPCLGQNDGTVMRMVAQSTLKFAGLEATCEIRSTKRGKDPIAICHYFIRS